MRRSWQLHHRENEIESLKAQHQSQLSHILMDKQKQEEKNNTLRQQLNDLGREEKQLLETHQAQLDRERELQEQSESHWAKLIDDARQERLSQEKSFQKEKEVLKGCIEMLQSENRTQQSQYANRA